MGRSGHARALSRADGSALTGSALTAAVSAASGEPGGGLALLEAALEETGLPARGGIFVGALRGCAAQPGRWEEALLEILHEIHEMTRDLTRGWEEALLEILHEIHEMTRDLTRGWEEALLGRGAAGACVTRPRQVRDMSTRRWPCAATLRSGLSRTGAGRASSRLISAHLG